VDAEPWATDCPGAASRLAARAVESGYDLIVASGGDGTLNEVLQGMVGSKVPLAVWPRGTANVLAKDLGMPIDTAAVADVVVTGRERRITVGRANDRYFFLMAGVGLDASIIRDVDPELKARIGEKAFWLSGLKHLFAWQPQPFQLQIDGRFYEGAFAAIGNSSGYGGGFHFTPRASVLEPSLDVAIFPARRFAFEYTKDVVACLLGDAPARDVARLKTQSVVATPLGEEPPWVQVDGELLATLPMEFTAIPDALTVLTPPGEWPPRKR
jgi:YegS/Rv2252/BmrU family lipid kinase